MAQIIPLSQVPLWRKDGPSNQLDPGLKWKWGPLASEEWETQTGTQTPGPPTVRGVIRATSKCTYMMERQGEKDTQV